MWKEVPFVAYFSLSLMSSINKTLGGEASINLGASKLRTFFSYNFTPKYACHKKGFLNYFNIFLWSL